MQVDDPVIVNRSLVPARRGFDLLGPDAVNSRGDNPLCGDMLTMGAVLSGKGPSARIQAVAWEGYGCSLCLGTADILAEQVRGTAVSDLLKWSLDDVLGLWGDLKVGRMRARCALLPLETLQEALRDCAVDVER